MEQEGRGQDLERGVKLLVESSPLSWLEEGPEQRGPMFNTLCNSEKIAQDISALEM